MLSYFFSAALYAASTEIHQHKAREIGEDTPVPEIALSVFRDSMNGVNIHLTITNYILGAPDFATNASISEDGFLYGHAHAFVNGIKRQRLYGQNVHIPNTWMKTGVNQMAISLNSHQHENWILNQENIVASVFLDLAKETLVLHHFLSQPIENEHTLY